jgi:hypothetical protein
MPVSSSKGDNMRDQATRCSVLVIVMALALLAAACGGSNSTSSLPTASTTVTSTTESFSGSIGQNASAVHPFTVTTGGYTLLAGFTTLSPSTVTSLGMGIGTYDAATSTCGLNQAQADAAKSGSTAISGTAGSGAYCIRVYDGGNIPAGTTVSYTLQIQHY